MSAATRRGTGSFMSANQLPRTRWLPAAAMAAGLLLTGCTGAAHGTASQLEQTTITVDAFTAIDTAGLFIAEQDGLFARAGLNVKLRLQSLVQPEVDDLAAGRADIISGDYVTFIEDQTAGAPDLHNEKVDLRIIAESSFLQPNVLMVVAPRNGSVTSIASLEGKRIAVLAPRNISLVLVESLLQDYGIPLSRERFPFIPFPEVGTAFAHDEMDASFVPEPCATSRSRAWRPPRPGRSGIRAPCGRSSPPTTRGSSSRPATGHRWRRSSSR